MRFSIARTVLFLVGMASPVLLQCADATARIELELAAGTQAEIVVYTITESGQRGTELVREVTDNFDGELGWEFDVAPGCYAVSIDVDYGSGGAGNWLDPVSRQPTFCLEAGETEVFETGRRGPVSPGRFVRSGRVVDPSGNVVGGVGLEFFEAPQGLTASEVRMLDHNAADYRGPLVSSRVGGGWTFPTFSTGCFIQTLTAPDGYSWADGRQSLTRSTCTNNSATIVAYPNSDPSPAHGSIELDIPSEMLGVRMTTSISTADADAVAFDWFRIIDTTNQFRSLSDVPPGCYTVQFGREDETTIWSATGRALQPVPVCVGSGETVVVSPLGEVRTVDYDANQPFITGSFVSENGAPESGVQVDFFHPRPGISDEELRNVDHSTADYRGTFYRSTVSGADGQFALPIYERCFVATFIAPEGLQFDTGRFKQVTRCQGDTLNPLVMQPA